MVDTIFRPFRSSEAERSDRSAGDRLRHRQKIRESIRENIADIIAEESIIGKSRDRVIKVPIRGIREYRFVYAYQEQAEALFQNYLDHAEAFVNKTRVKDRNTREELQPDEAFLKSIEEQIAIIGSAAEGFRQEVIAYLWALSRRGERITYKSYEPLKEAIEKKLTESVRELSRIITTARTRDEEQATKYNAMVRNLLDNGYCESCVDVVLKYAANNLWKD